MAHTDVINCNPFFLFMSYITSASPLLTIAFHSIATFSLILYVIILFLRKLINV